jgi:nucleotide-binding universal stress UspA family protein
MTHPVVVGVSFEDHWDPLGGLAVVLARALGADVTLLHVLAKGADPAEEKWGETLESWFSERGVRATMEWAHGDPAGVLLQRADPDRASALLLGTSTVQNSTVRGFLGSSVSRVLREGRGRIGVVPDATNEPGADGVNRVLFPTDFSDVSNNTLTDAHALTRAMDAELHLLHVVRSPTQRGVFFEQPLPPSRDERDNLGRARVQLKKLRTSIGGDAEVHTMMAPTPAHGVVARADEIGADLVIMPSRGAGLVSRLLLGSVADAVVRMASQPVLVLK